MPQFLGFLNERNGDFAYKHHLLLTASSPAAAAARLEEVAGGYYDGKVDPDGEGGYFFHGGEVCVSAGSCQEISAATFAELQNSLPRF